MIRSSETSNVDDDDEIQDKNEDNDEEEDEEEDEDEDEEEDEDDEEEEDEGGPLFYFIYIFIYINCSFLQPTSWSPRDSAGPRTQMRYVFSFLLYHLYLLFFFHHHSRCHHCHRALADGCVIFYFLLYLYLY
jgi:hypothetical protein